MMSSVNPRPGRPGTALTRRRVLGLFAGSAALAACSGTADRPVAPDTGSTAATPLTTGTVPSAVTKIHYGTDDHQFGELYLPTGPRRVGTAVIIHGGFWLSDYNSSLGTDLAKDLAARGWPAWNLEYRRLGYTNGGWPTTFQDIAAGVDHLGTLGDAALDLSKVVAIGHSAGGQLATWAAGRPGLPTDAPGANPAVPLTGVISQAGVLDLTTAAQENVGNGVVEELLGGDPDAVPDRYLLADPIRRLPIGVPVRALHSKADGNVPFAQSTAYVDAATAAGDDAVLVETQGDHFQHISVESAAWALAVQHLTELTA